MLSTDPQTLLLTAGRDLDISAGRTRFARGLVAAAQQADARIVTTRGSLPWNRTLGFPLYANAFVDEADAVLGRRFDSARAETIFRQTLMSTPNASSIERIRIDFNPRLRQVKPEFQLRIAFDDASGTVS